MVCTFPIGRMLLASAILLSVPLTSLASSQQAAANEDGDAVEITAERLSWHIPDPDTAKDTARAKIEQAKKNNDNASVRQQTRVIELINGIHRDQRVGLSLEEVVQRTLASNYTIQVASHNPAIELTKVIEAEAAFDALFFTTVNKSNIDRPTANELIPTDLDLTTIRTGVRKILPTGMQVGAQYELDRTHQVFGNVQFQTINPEYVSRLVFEGRQPLLRNFGLDYNRSLIIVADNEHKVSVLAFRRQVRETLRQVEEAYWRLVQARRDVVISARVLAMFEGIYDYLVARKDFDVTPVQIEGTKADLQQSLEEFVERRANLFDAEDRLKAAMNDPELNLAVNVELIPDDFPMLSRIVIDPLAEVQVALEHRSEIQEQQLRIASAKILRDRAKNEEQPKLDLTFRVSHDGLAGTADSSFDEASRRKFISYTVGVEFEVPIGNRAPKAASYRASLEHARAVAQLQELFEGIILEVNLAARKMETNFDKVQPSFLSAEAREREAMSLVARAERKDYNTLRNELGAWQGLASIRRAMLSTMVEYNIAIIELERTKGTLLEYNNVVIPTTEK